MQNEKEENTHDQGEMKKRRVIMEDGKRYIIFYTFEKPVSPLSGEKQQPEERENV